jgi:hypothetical protein
MKRIFYLTTIILITLSKCLSQGKKDSVNINFVKAPSSPAANILAFSPSEIQSPSDPSAFVASFQNSTSNFTALPKSFAVDIAPFWFFGGKSRTYTEYTSDKIWDNLKQSLVVSVAYRDSSNALKGYKNNSLIGFGGKISLFRGRNNSVEDFMMRSRKLDSLIENLVDNNATLVRLNAKADSLGGIGMREEAKKIRNSAVDFEEKLKQQILQKFNSDKVNIASKETVRNGFKMDIAGGFSYRYPQNNVDSSLSFRGGVWTTFGYDWADKNKEGQLSFLLMLRYFKNPAQIWADEKGVLKGKTEVSTFDYGLKTSYINGGIHSTTINLELLYRSILSKQNEKSRVEPSLRLAFNANYEVSKTIVLSLAVGKDFDGSISKSGNVFAFLNLITAFGSGTKIVDK